MRTSTGLNYHTRTLSGRKRERGQGVQSPAYTVHPPRPAPPAVPGAGHRALGPVTARGAGVQARPWAASPGVNAPTPADAILGHHARASLGRLKEDGGPDPAVVHHGRLRGRPAAR